MILFPAIDLKDGACVRLVRGEMASATVFNDDPAAQARSFAEAGLRAGCTSSISTAPSPASSVNGAAVRAIRARGRSADPARRRHPRPRRDRLLARRSASTGSCSAPPRCATPNWCAQAARALPGRIVVGIDARDGKVAVEGWAETSDVEAVDLARRFDDAGVAAIVYTDIARDGALTGVDAAATAAFARAVGIPVIASGGVASLADIAALTAHARGRASPARSAAARSMTAGSTRARRCASAGGGRRRC